VNSTLKPRNADVRAPVAKAILSRYSSGPREVGPGAPLETYIASAVLVALAEMGDRTQLLAIMLAGRYRAPVPVLLGILAATLANHGLAAVAGFYLAAFLSSLWFRYAVAASFIAMALWALIPDRDGDEESAAAPRWGVFLATAVTFFLVEIGDKTQVATAALAARFHNVVLVTAGTTTGMMIANVPAVLFGHRVTGALSVRWLRLAAALVYLALGLWSFAVTAGWVKTTPF
jgi:putative Ca2+/H+ antiporter (TMEM165/GDT1 family)